MEDVSVLLNLTGKIAFERTDPLLDLVSGHGPFLFHDVLSLERFPLAWEEQEGHVKKILCSLRNLLEGRRLSVEDTGGSIRLLITLDLVGGFAHLPGQFLCFPAQKALRFKEMLHSAFEQDAHLLDRFECCFIFLESDADDNKVSDFYRTLAYDGYTGQPASWIPSEMLSANDASECREKSRAISAFLSRAGVAEAFNMAVSDSYKRDGSFDDVLKSSVSCLLGVCSKELSDSTFIIFKQRTGTASLRRKDEMVLVSLLQLLGTMSRSDFRIVTGLADSNSPATLSIVNGGLNESSLDKAALSALRSDVSSCLPGMRSDGAFRWTKNKKVSYKEYTAKQVDPVESDIYKELNDNIQAHRKEQYETFVRLRRIPFFFGRKTGDWKWYQKMTAILDEISEFERKNDRPLVSTFRRISDKEMNFVEKEATYGELEILRNELEKEHPSGSSIADLKHYLAERDQSMAVFDKLKEKLKDEMVKLGFAVTTFWIALLSGLVFTLCYAFHFIYVWPSENPIWIAICFVAVCLLFALSAIIARSRIKLSIQSLILQLDECYVVSLQGGQKAYLDQINQRAKVQIEADVRRKNLNELQEKLNGFDRHNKQVDLWERHFDGLKKKLDEMLELVGGSVSEAVESVSEAEISTLDLEDLPYLPLFLCSRYREMRTVLSQGKVLEGVTCFLNRVEVTNVHA